jgi:hypothetical protein
MKNQRGINTHIRFKHKDWTVEKYYLSFMPNYCIECGNLIPFNGEKYLQAKFCNQKCLAKRFSQKIPTNKGQLKYNKNYLIQILQEIHEKYKGAVTQQLVRLDGRVNFQIYHKYFGSFTAACQEAKIPFFSWSCPKDKFVASAFPLTVIIDSREKKPYPFEDFIIKKLDVGDYQLQGVDNIVIERKDKGDLKSCVFTKRFWKELERAREQKIYVVVLVDCTIKRFMKDKNFGVRSNKQIMHRVKEMGSIFADTSQFLFTGSRKNSAELVYKLSILEPIALKGADLQEIWDKNKFEEYFFGKNGN